MDTKINLGCIQTKMSQSHSDENDEVVEYNSNHMYAWILAITFVIALIVSAIYSARFSNLLATASITGGAQKALCRKINDISTCSWFFVTIPVLNLGLAGGLGYHVSKLQKMVK